MRCRTEDLAAFVAGADTWLCREPVLHNVLRTLVVDRLSSDVPLSGEERFVRVVDDHVDALIKRFASGAGLRLTQTS
ncbi:hypothetical protein [Micromonospora sp. LH3U1]|uniref:hypothetical protein n=1 Tax=Micromonospora sp. LH3U1 TaxID=3018339 RepID=UPI00234B6FC6|nr:hypothetical protein [Micromonospora sp. LH3U1]WCN80006.1 hypothetical protein PCA76_24055 [Micromonospora sp. LH3U1]